MKKIILKNIPLTLGVFMLILTLSAPFLNPPSVSAKTATDYCRSALAPKTPSNVVSACETGFNAGKNGQSGSVCRGAGSADAVSTCTSAYNAGKNERNTGGGGGGGTGGGSSGGGGGTSGTSSGTGADGGPAGSGSGAETTPAPGPETINCGDEGVNCTDPAAKKTGTCDNNGCNLIGRYVNPAITVLSALVVVASIASLIYGGIQYSMSAGDPQKIAEAKDRITKTIIAFIIYLFLFSFLQFLIPGGIL